MTASSTRTQFVYGAAPPVAVTEKSKAVSITEYRLALDEKDIEIGLLSEFVGDFLVGEESCDDTAVSDKHNLDISRVAYFVIKSA